MPRCSRSALAPVSVSWIPRLADRPKIQSASKNALVRAAPRDPARWWCCSVQSKQNRSSGRDLAGAASRVLRPTPRLASTGSAEGPNR